MPFFIHKPVPLIMLALTATLGSVPVAQAANPKKAALKALKASAGDIVKEFRTSVKLDRKVLSADLDDIESDVAKGLITSEAGATQLFNALAGMQEQVALSIAEAREDIRLAMKQAEDILVAANIPSENYPVGFAYGDGGAGDDLLADIRREIDKHYDAVHKRLGDSKKAFKKSANRAMSFRVEAPTMYVERTGIGPHTDPRPVTIDVAIATRRLDVVDDVVLHLAGSCRSSDGSLSMTVANQFGGWVQPAIMPDPNDRWSRSVDAGAPLNYSISVTSSGVGGGGGYIAIGVR